MPQYGPAASLPSVVVVRNAGDGFIETTPGGPRMKVEITSSGGEKTWKLTIKDPADSELKEVIL